MNIGSTFPAGGFAPRTYQGVGGQGVGGAAGAGGRVRDAEIIAPVRRVEPTGKRDPETNTALRPTIEILAPGDVPGSSRPAKEPASLRNVPRGNPLSAYVATAALESHPPSRGSFFDYTV